MLTYNGRGEVYTLARVDFFKIIGFTPLLGTQIDETKVYTADRIVDLEQVQGKVCTYSRADRERGPSGVFCKKVLSVYNE
jgi:hypothetical protein